MPIKYSSSCSSATQSGFSLIEVLVSLFVLAIGLLGVIAMQINSVKSNQRAQYTAVVKILAADFTDRIYAYNANLPAGRGLVSYDAGSAIYTITILWDAERTGVAGAECSGNPNVDLTCHIVEVSLL